MFIIITKIELETFDTLKHTEFAYTTNQIIADEVNEDYDVTLGVYLAENRTGLENGSITIDGFFVGGVTYVYEARMIAGTIEGLDLIEINDTSNLP